jgi:hypothetical protein
LCRDLADHLAGQQPRDSEDSMIETRWNQLVPAYLGVAANL